MAGVSIDDHIISGNLAAFVETLGWICRYDVSDIDLEVINHGVFNQSDGETGNYYSYPLMGEKTIDLNLALDPGTCVILLRLSMPEELAEQVQLAIDVFQRFEMVVDTCTK